MFRIENYPNDDPWTATKPKDALLWTNEEAKESSLYKTV